MRWIRQLVERDGWLVARYGMRPIGTALQKDVFTPSCVEGATSGFASAFVLTAATRDEQADLLTPPRGSKSTPVKGSGANRMTHPAIVTRIAIELGQ